MDFEVYQDDSQESRYLTVIIALLEEIPDDKEHHQFAMLLQNAKELLATMALNKINNTFETIRKNRPNIVPDWQQLLVDVRSFMLYSNMKGAANQMLLMLNQAGMDASDPFVTALLTAKPKKELKSLEPKPPPTPEDLPMAIVAAPEPSAPTPAQEISAMDEKVDAAETVATKSKKRKSSKQESIASAKSTALDHGKKSSIIPEEPSSDTKVKNRRKSIDSKDVKLPANTTMSAASNARAPLIENTPPLTSTRVSVAQIGSQRRASSSNQPEQKYSSAIPPQNSEKLNSEPLPSQLIRRRSTQLSHTSSVATSRPATFTEIETHTSEIDTSKDKDNILAMRENPTQTQSSSNDESMYLRTKSEQASKAFHQPSLSFSASSDVHPALLDRGPYTTTHGVTPSQNKNSHDNQNYRSLIPEEPEADFESTHAKHNQNSAIAATATATRARNESSTTTHWNSRPDNQSERLQNISFSVSKQTHDQEPKTRKSTDYSNETAEDKRKFQTDHISTNHELSQLFRKSLASDDNPNERTHNAKEPPRLLNSFKHSHEATQSINPHQANVIEFVPIGILNYSNPQKPVSHVAQNPTNFTNTASRFREEQGPKGNQPQLPQDAPPPLIKRFSIFQAPEELSAVSKVTANRKSLSKSQQLLLHRKNQAKQKTATQKQQHQQHQQSSTETLVQNSLQSKNLPFKLVGQSVSNPQPISNSLTNLSNTCIDTSLVNLRRSSFPRRDINPSLRRNFIGDRNVHEDEGLSSIDTIGGDHDEPKLIHFRPDEYYQRYRYTKSLEMLPSDSLETSAPFSTPLYDVSHRHSITSAASRVKLLHQNSALLAKDKDGSDGREKACDVHNVTKQVSLQEEDQKRRIKSREEISYARENVQPLKDLKPLSLSVSVLTHNNSSNLLQLNHGTSSTQYPAFPKRGIHPFQNINCRGQQLLLDGKTVNIPYSKYPGIAGIAATGTHQKSKDLKTVFPKLQQTLALNSNIGSFTVIAKVMDDRVEGGFKFQGDECLLDNDGANHREFEGDNSNRLPQSQQRQTPDYESNTDSNGKRAAKRSLLPQISLILAQPSGKGVVVNSQVTQTKKVEKDRKFLKESSSLKQLQLQGSVSQLTPKIAQMIAKSKNQGYQAIHDSQNQYLQDFARNLGHLYYQQPFVLDRNNEQTSDLSIDTRHHPIQTDAPPFKESHETDSKLPILPTSDQTFQKYDPQALLHKRDLYIAILKQQDMAQVSNDSKKSDSTKHNSNQSKKQGFNPQESDKRLKGSTNNPNPSSSISKNQLQIHKLDIINPFKPKSKKKKHHQRVVVDTNVDAENSCASGVVAYTQEEDSPFSSCVNLQSFRRVAKEPESVYAPTDEDKQIIFWENAMTLSPFPR
ncbi:hypothetical protein BDR26DRAFT_1005516 [Obelidium mucronatum]|nr:hypothetical protein BDR26DRAFT_1005516 [Obelidium mucronatum]